MRKFKFMLACLTAAAALAAGFTACSDDDDPDYTPPSIGMGGSESGNNSSTIDFSDGSTTFELPVNIVSEAGLASIVVKDGTGKEWLRQTEFADPNHVQSVTIDLGSLTESTQLYLTVEATAKDGKVSVSAPYSLTVNVPVLYVRMNPVSTMTDEATIDIVIGRGVKALSKAVVYKNGAQLSEISLAESAKDKKVLESAKVTGLEEGKNEIKVEVYEEGMSEASASETVNVTRINISDIYMFEMSTGEDMEAVNSVIYLDNFPEYIYLKKGVAMGQTENTWNLTFDDSKEHIVEINQQIHETGMTETWEMIDESYSRIYKFTYNEYNELVKVTLDDGDGDADYITDVAYGPNGIESYKVEGKEYVPQYTAEGIRIDCLDAGMSGKKFVYDGTENVNPFYLSSLPAVIPGDDVTGIPLQIFYTPYLFNKIEGGWNAGWESGFLGEVYPYYGTTATKDDKEYTIHVVFNPTN